MSPRVTWRSTILTSLSSPNKPFLTFLYPRFINRNVKKNQLSQHLCESAPTSKASLNEICSRVHLPQAPKALVLPISRIYARSVPRRVVSSRDPKEPYISPTPRSALTSPPDSRKLPPLMGHPMPNFKRMSHQPEIISSTSDLSLKPVSSQKKVVVQSQGNTFVPTRKEGINKNREETSRPAQDKVMVLWDLDNLRPEDPPYDTAMLLKQFAGLFGEVMAIKAFGNDVTCSSVKSNRNTCPVCAMIREELEEHFKSYDGFCQDGEEGRLQGSQRSRQKLKKYLAAFHYTNFPRATLENELKRAGVHVERVKSTPQAADVALEREWQRNTRGMNASYDWLILLSNDADFRHMLEKAKMEGVAIVMVCNNPSMGIKGDFWLPWKELREGHESLTLLSKQVVKTSTSGQSKNISSSVVYEPKKVYGKQMLTRKEGGRLLSWEMRSKLLWGLSDSDFASLMKRVSERWILKNHKSRRKTRIAGFQKRIAKQLKRFPLGLQIVEAEQ
ncbi:hypothetical protein NHQ30_010874 [Ciborinia camelliae]|nr:hypothetical protein NHQ30_010874 [Ciborinia camelliae]